MGEGDRLDRSRFVAEVNRQLPRVAEQSEHESDEWPFMCECLCPFTASADVVNAGSRMAAPTTGITKIAADAAPTVRRCRTFLIAKLPNSGTRERAEPGWLSNE